MNRPQAIIIIGNIASGKTTLAEAIARELPDFAIVCLDDIRADLMDNYPDMNSVVRERNAEAIALKSIDQNRQVIFESTGTSQFYHRAMNRIREKFQTFTIKLHADPKICIKRFEERKKNGKHQIPPGWHKVNTQIDSQIFQINDLLKDRNADFMLTSVVLEPMMISTAAIKAYSKFIS